MRSIATPADMKLINRLFRFTTPESLPLSFIYNGTPVHGIPAEFSPTVETQRTDANIQKTTICGRNADGLEIRVEYVEYLDYAATEFLAFVTNAGEADTGLISELKILDGVLPCESASLLHGNGDTCEMDGYSWFCDAIKRPISLATADGTSCRGVFPYMRLLCGNFGVNLAIGWPAMWRADFEPAEGGVRIRIGQKRSSTILHPGETLRTPRVNLVAYEGDESRGINMWRRWYLTHILPREDGQPLPPKCCMHVSNTDGHPEFTGATEENQLRGIETYITNGLHPDIWWLDAGWYECHYDWWPVGSWKVDPERFPNSLAPIGKKCDENGMRFLLWFEPERAYEGSELDREHPEWLLRLTAADGTVDPNRLVNLGNPECCDWIINRIDSIIKASGVKIYRQDFNFSVAPHWEQAEAENRIGAIENFHVQGYLRLWDTLIARNPGLWIDSCAGGGRRNDLETMRRAVPLHYTDVGYGHHPIKQKQHRQMFEWIPYFRAHNMNWCDDTTGNYRTQNRPVDRFSYYNAMAPVLTEVLELEATEDDYALAREMHPIWRKAAELMLSGDYYPLTPCRASQEAFCALQFHDPDTEKGFLEIMRNNRCHESAFVAELKDLNPNAVYALTEAESCEITEFTGADLTAGVRFELPIHTGRIYFYERKR